MTGMQIDAILGPAGPDVLCDECFDRLDEFVDMELRGEPAGERLPGMRAHFDGCPACREDYESLRDIASG